MRRRIFYFLIVPLFWTGGCEILGNEGGYECEPPPCPPNANCINRCGDLFIADAEGGGALNLTRSVRGEWEPVWSPDGSAIAFVEEAGARLAAISVMTSSGGNRRRLTRPGFYAGLTWSPDGAHLAFASADTLYVIKADGTDLRRLNTASLSFRPRWSPDGRHLSFFVVAEGGLWHLHVIEADGTNERRLAPTLPNIETAAWSPDGSRIAFSGDDRDQPSGIYTINVDGSGLAMVSRPGLSGRDPRWSPDGQRIAFRGGALTLMDADGRHRQVLAGGNITDLAWSPDGRALVYSAYDGVAFGLFRFDIERGEKQHIADVPTDVYDVQWSPEGRRILFGG